MAVIYHRYFKEEQQRDVDRRIRVLCNKTRCQFGRFYQPRQTQNAIRQAYSESQIGRFLTSQSAEGEANHNETARQRYAAVVVSGPDYYLLRPIPVAEVKIFRLKACLQRLSPALYHSGTMMGDVAKFSPPCHGP